MNRLTNEQRLQIIEFYYKNACSVKKVYRALLPFYGQFNRPTEAAIRAIRAIVTKFRTKFTLLDIKPPTPPTRLRRVRTEENIAAVSASVNDDHQLSIRRRSPFAAIGPLLLNNVENFAKGFRCEAFQNTAGARIEAERPTATQKRRIFGEWALGKLAEDPLFYRKIVFSDEAHFWINGYVNKQNCRFWSEDQPEELQELPMYPEKVTGHSLVRFMGWRYHWTVGPYFFKDAANRNVTVNGERYREMISNFFLPKMQELDLHDMWFQQDGATCHMPHSTRNNGLVERRVR